jgi:hypothetical protein
MQKVLILAMILTSSLGAANSKDSCREAADLKWFVDSASLQIKLDNLSFDSIACITTIITGDAIDRCRCHEGVSVKQFVSQEEYGRALAIGLIQNEAIQILDRIEHEKEEINREYEFYRNERDERYRACGCEPPAPTPLPGTTGL